MFVVDIVRGGVSCFDSRPCLVFEENLVPGLGHECGYAPITTDPYWLKAKPSFRKEKISICFPLSLSVSRVLFTSSWPMVSFLGEGAIVLTDD